MKFGKTFASHQVPEWSHSYMNYKALKKLIKAINKRQEELLLETPELDTINDQEVKSSLAAFFYALDRNIERVDDFYNKQYAEYDRRLKKLSSILGIKTGAIDDEDAEELVGALLELRNCFRNLKWFGELNKRGFTKILKKLDKKTGTNSQETFFEARISALPFANESDILKSLASINEFLTQLGPKADLQDLKEEVLSSASSVKNVEGSTHSLTPPVTQKGSGSTDKYMPFLQVDDAAGLNSELIKEYMSPVLAPLKLLISILNKAALVPSYRCIDTLLDIVPVLSDSSDISGRNFFHHHVVALGKQYVKTQELMNQLSKESQYTITPATPPDANLRLVGAFGPDGINSNDSSKGLLYIFENLPPHLKFAILQKDNYKRTPLHYAAQYGLKEVTSIILTYLKKWNLWNDAISIDDTKVWGDSEVLTPLHLAVLGTHPLTTEVLLTSMAPNVGLTCPDLLLLSARLNSPEILGLLLSRNVDIDFVDPDTHETALYIAAKLNIKNALDFLLSEGANTEIGELSFGWTPIFVAAVEGLEAIVRSLKDHGAKYDNQDQSGWSPMEHACLRGHLEIAKLLTPPDYDPLKVIQTSLNNGSGSTIVGSDASSVVSSEPTTDDFKPKVYSNQGLANSIEQLSLSSNHLAEKSIYKSIKLKRVNSPPPRPVKSFGHRYLKPSESLILITLGTTDLRDQSPAIDLKRVPLSKAHSTELDTALSVVVSAKGLDQPSAVLDLPLDDNHGSATDPISFKCSGEDPLDSVIYFDIVPTYAYGEQRLMERNGTNTKQKVLGRAVAIVRSAYTSVGLNRRSLSSNVTVPILESETLEVLGSIRFELMLVNPFDHPKMTIGRTETYWKSLVSTRVIGHRGYGMNSRDRKSLQLGENTVESFIAAASLGASYVEFDVQLTKDDVPVVYHDFLVAESGVDVPMHALTAEQFLGLNKDEDHSMLAHERKSVDDEVLTRNRPRSMSLVDDDIAEFSGTNQDRMKLTKTWKLKKYKGNTRGSSIASSFVTLVELFKKLPRSVGFNIECKYPMLDEAEHEDMGQVAVDMNHWVDTVLKVVYDNADGRDIMFSSFHPDICVLLSLKQPSIPILFLTEAGTQPMADVRAASLQNAIRFAKKWNLLGIVSAAETLVMCPRLASVVKATGLVCVTYGQLNNDPENAKLEMLAGVDAVIVDSVLAVRKELRDGA
ncbi:unnamed protein product [Kuraishia capsulata CBS 1993]|uniref:Uncharacterized protein n=1 Tax=Kuraishia capsulata CBS 1993 TaxID=1382522 RepID=W6MQF8_9ASCO|nr:uncharacterized protein KUCA_T00004911001 [Kuraishia capsulata CBS 1993]CDK28926.1 unnamed protein product [Kuraishia capsulata CBS 1993]